MAVEVSIPITVLRDDPEPGFRALAADDVALVNASMQTCPGSLLLLDVPSSPIMTFSVRTNNRPFGPLSRMDGVVIAPVERSDAPRVISVVYRGTRLLEFELPGALGNAGVQEVWSGRSSSQAAG